MTIEEMNLAPVAEHAARLLKAKHPQVIFTSGRRGLAEQAHAMASNIVASGNRKWIARTYASNTASRALQLWVDTHPQIVSVTGLAVGLEKQLELMPAEIVGQISRHLDGRAFDVAPVAGPAGEAIKATIRSLPGLQKFLEREGSLIRWHAQF